MAKLTSRDRVRRTLRHEEPDRIPLTLGADAATTLTAGAYENLKTYLGISGETRLFSKARQTVFVDEKILKHFQIDTRPLTGKGLRNWKERDIGNQTFLNEWGIRQQMPRGGSSYQIVDFPLKEATIEDLEEYPWPDPLDEGLVEGIEEEAKELYEHSDYAVVGSSGLSQSIFEQSWYLRGMDTLLMDFMTDKEFAHALLRKVTEVQKVKYGRFLDKVGKYLDVVRVSDDLGMQTGPLMSPQLYREMIKPYHRDYFSFIKAKTDAKLLLHCCGSISMLIDDFMDVGVDILNPIQVSAVNMNCPNLKKEFGDRLSFWGAIDTQQILPCGSPEEVKEEVRGRIRELGLGGGFIPSAVNSIQHDVPPQNIVAMVEAIKEYGEYPLKV